MVSVAECPTSRQNAAREYAPWLDGGDEHEETIGDFISPEMEWLYGYDSQHHAYMVLLRDETILHSDSALNVLAADNGDMITVFYRSPGYEIAKNDGDLKRFFRGLVLGQ